MAWSRDVATATVLVTVTGTASVTGRSKRWPCMPPSGSKPGGVQPARTAAADAPEIRVRSARAIPIRLPLVWAWTVSSAASGPCLRGGHRHRGQVAVGQLGVLGHVGVGDAGVAAAADAEGPAPPHGGQRGFQRGQVRLGHGHDPALEYPELPPGVVFQAARPVQQGALEVQRAAFAAERQPACRTTSGRRLS